MAKSRLIGDYPVIAIAAGLPGLPGLRSAVQDDPVNAALHRLLF